jgi:hypothetical protein
MHSLRASGATRLSDTCAPRTKPCTFGSVVEVMPPERRDPGTRLGDGLPPRLRRTWRGVRRAQYRPGSNSPQAVASEWAPSGRERPRRALLP